MKLHIGTGDHVLPAPWINLATVFKAQPVTDAVKIVTHPLKRTHDGNRLPFDTGSFDEVRVTDVFHTLPHPQDLLDELHRVTIDEVEMLVQLPHGSQDAAYGMDAVRQYFPLTFMKFDGWHPVKLGLAIDMNNPVVQANRGRDGKLDKDNLMFSIHHARNAVSGMEVILKKVAKGVPYSDALLEAHIFTYGDQPAVLN